MIEIPHCLGWRGMPHQSYVVLGAAALSLPQKPISRSFAASVGACRDAAKAWLGSVVGIVSVGPIPRAPAPETALRRSTIRHGGNTARVRWREQIAGANEAGTRPRPGRPALQRTDHDSAMDALERRQGNWMRLSEHSGLQPQHGRVVLIKFGRRVSNQMA